MTTAPTAKQTDYRSELDRTAAANAAAMTKANAATAKAETALADAQAAAAAASSAMTTASAAQQLATLSRIDFGVLAYTNYSIIAGSLGPQPFVFDVASAKAGDRVNIYPVTVPANYAIVGNGYCTTDGKLTVTIYRPLLAFAANVNLTFRAIAYRDPPAA